MLPRTAADDNEPTNPKLWEKCKAKAKSRYTKWPSAYAVGHALKLYKDEGGGWKKTAGETTKIDPAWVKGIRAWVKKTFAPKPRYASLDDIIAHLKTLRDKDLNRFWEYLFYTKGLLPRGVDPELIIERFRAKIAEELKAARELLDADLTKIQHTRDAMTPGTHTYRLDQQQGPQWSVLGFYERINPADPFGAALKGYEDVAKETLAKVEDTLSGKLLRAITAFLGKYADGQPFESEEILLEYTIGKVKLVYDGEPDRYIINRPDPGDPRGLSDYIPYLKKVKALLEQKGFGNLWYGPIFIGCPKCGGENPQGKHFGVGAHYLRGPDHVVVYLEPKPFLVELLIHELGHRYYFKFMDAGDRARFDSYFKEVAAVSEYGGTTTQEDFAEVFAHFVLGRDMTRDQIERFKAFLAKKDRGRFASPVRVSSLPAKIPASVLYDGGWEWDMGGFANWPSFETKPKSEQIAWAKEFLGSGLREPVDVTVWADGQASFQDGHHRVMAGKVLGLEIPVRISFRNFNPDYWPALFELLKAGYSRRDYNPQGWSLKRSGVPPLEVVRRGRGEADQWIMDHDVPPSRSASALASRVASRYLAGEDRKYKMPRKFDREHCESKSCDEMGFTEKASCRPYKNCYRGASEVTRVEVTTEWAEGLQKWVDTAFPPLELNEWPTVDGAISRIGTYQRNLNNLWDNINYTQGLKSLETGIRYKGVESVPKRDLDLAVNEEFKSAQKILSAIAEPILRNRGYYLHEPYVSRFNKKLETLRAVLKNRVLGKIRDFLRSEGGSIERPRRTLQLTIGDMSVVLKSPDMPPGYLEKYIQYFKKAKALLDQKGFGDLWYGTAFVDCPKCGGENQHGKHLGVAAHYLRVPDHIVVFLEPHPFMVELLIHELGHRYYFKVMDRGDRARFDSYFKEVAAVSEYGGTVTEEDFAEVFAHFVLGRGMTRDQIERFKAFLAKKDRGRFASAAPRYLSAKGKARKDVGHGGLDEWFSGHGQGKDKAPGEAQWGDWVAISPVKRTVTREDGTKKTYEPGDIIGPCGALTDDPDWKDLTRGGKTPFKCMARPKAHDMPKDERAEKAREKMKVQEKAPKGKKPVNTPTFKDDE